MGPGEYIRKHITLFNIVAVLIILGGVSMLALRFLKGLGAVTEGSYERPWGLFIGVNMLCGVVLSASGYVMGAAVYLLRLRQYLPVYRVAVLIGSLGYFFAVMALICDIGRPWRIYFPMFVSLEGTASVMFILAWSLSLSLTFQFFELSPAIFEWLNLKKIRDYIEHKLMTGAVIFTVTSATIHQSALGGLFLITPGKLHPLWYSPFIPLFFFISSIASGLAMMIVVTTLCERYLKDKCSPQFREALPRLHLGLGKACAVVLFAFFGLRLIGIAHGDRWHLLNTPYGWWFSVEMLIFLIAPYILLAGVRKKDVGLVRFGAFFTLVGVVINRINFPIVAFNWQLHDLRFPPVPETLITLGILTTWVVLFRWVANRMPVLWEDPKYKWEIP